VDLTFNPRSRSVRGARRVGLEALGPRSIRASQPYDHGLLGPGVLEGLGGSTGLYVSSAEEPIVRRHPRTSVPYLQHRAGLHRTPICDGSRLPGQPSRPTFRRRLAFNIKLRELTAGDGQQTLDALADRLSTRTLQILRNCLERAIRHAETRDVVGRNVAAVVKPPQGNSGSPVQEPHPGAGAGAAGLPRRTSSKLPGALRVGPSGDQASGPVSGRATTRPATLVEALRPFIGLWVAVRGDEVLVAAPSPKDVVAWLARHGQRGQSMFRVPDSEQAVTGAAPQ
jgi:hypothetical protein